jgi:hypothetical protein
VRSSLTKRRNFRSFVAVLLLSLAGCRSESDPVLEETFERLYTIQPTADITIQNHDGAILVYGSNTNEMRVQATKKAYSPIRLKQIVIDVSVHPTSVSIDVKLPPKPKWALFDRSGTVDCTIVLPATANISRLRLDAGEVFVDGMHGGTVHARLGDGRIFAHNCFANANLALQRGNLILSYDWWEPGTFSMQADIGQGNAWAFLPGNAAFRLVAETGYGHLGNDFDDPAVVRSAFAEAAKIDMLVHGGGHAAIKLRTENGDIKVMAANP